MKKSITIFTVFLFIGAFNLNARITVKAVKGNVAYKKGGSWKKLTKGMTIPEGASVLSSSGSFALLSLSGHSVTIRPSSNIKIYSSGIAKGRSKNHVGVKHGSVKVKIKKMPKVKTSFKVSTPVATSSVRGTEEIVSFGPTRGMQVEVLHGMVDIANDRGVSNRVSGKQQFQAKTANETKSVLAEKQKQSTVNINDQNVTKEEAESFLDGNVEVVDSPDFLDELTNPQGDVQKTNVTVQVIWPQ